MIYIKYLISKNLMQCSSKKKKEKETDTCLWHTKSFLNTVFPVRVLPMIIFNSKHILKIKEKHLKAYQDFCLLWFIWKGLWRGNCGQWCHNMCIFSTWIHWTGENENKNPQLAELAAAPKISASLEEKCVCGGWETISPTFWTLWR